MAEVSKSKLLGSAGIPKNQDACIVIVRTEWNADIVDELENGCKSKLSEYGIKKILVLLVPGAFEISFAIKQYWAKNKKGKGKPNAFIALGCVLRGDTPHFDYVCRAVTDGVLQMNLMLPVPTVFGVLTVDNQQQAIDRIGGKNGHKGEEAAMTAIKMLTLPKASRK